MQQLFYDQLRIDYACKLDILLTNIHIILINLQNFVILHLIATKSSQLLYYNTSWTEAFEYRHM